MKRCFLSAAALAAALCLLPGCKGEEGAAAGGAAAVAERGLLPLTIATDGGERRFQVEVARTVGQQQRGLMYRTDIPADGGMLFYPYPPGGGGPSEASFWMRNTPTPLDIVFIRADGTIARIAENTIPYSEDPIHSGEPVTAVLEILGGKAAELGIKGGDKVRWPGRE